MRRPLPSRCGGRIEATDFPERPDDVITISIGVACAETADGSPRDAMLRADGRLYEAKRRRNAIAAGEIKPAQVEFLSEPASEPATDT